MRSKSDLFLLSAFLFVISAPFAYADSIVFSGDTVGVNLTENPYDLILVPIGTLDPDYSQWGFGWNQSSLPLNVGAVDVVSAFSSGPFTEYGAFLVDLSFGTNEPSASELTPIFGTFENLQAQAFSARYFSISTGVLIETGPPGQSPELEPISFSVISTTSAESMISGVGAAVVTSGLNLWKIGAAVIGILLALWGIEEVIGLFPQKPTIRRKRSKHEPSVK